MKLSVIIPLGPGETAWRPLLADLEGLDAEAEVLLVAAEPVTAGFPPATPPLGAPLRWLTAPAGRARQQNVGGAAARGDMLWFLHADSRVPPATLAAARAFAAPAALGYFDLHFRQDGPPLARLNACGARLRSRWLKLPFGDQGFILSRQLFDDLGGFDETVGAGEDHALVWAARAMGVPLLALGAPLHTSARRYREHGWLRTTLRHARLTVCQARRFAALARARSRG